MLNSTHSSTVIPNPTKAAGVNPPASNIIPPIPTPTPSGPGSATVALSSANPSTTVTPPTSKVSVTVPNTSGTVTFSLVVTDNMGIDSPPAFATVSIQSPPIAVLTATPETVAVGSAIELSGSGSTSSGSIASYKFSLVPAPV